ncbi:MAG TPA: RHS repeat-associated core domain-containing protein, partial [Anaerolineales bacterium]|nr:RHS repeat-associated core domain-containing protein [Anaerolineales bacterium]
MPRQSRSAVAGPDVSDHFPRIAVLRIKQDGNLFALIQGEIRRQEPAHEPERNPQDHIAHRAQRFLGRLAILAFPGEGGQLEKRLTRQCINCYINLDDYKSRWYSDQLGRFISPDDIVPDLNNPQSLNRYSYTSNDPINLTDPTGHVYQPVCTIFCSFFQEVAVHEQQAWTILTSQAPWQDRLAASTYWTAAKAMTYAPLVLSVLGGGEGAGMVISAKADVPPEEPLVSPSIEASATESGTSVETTSSTNSPSDDDILYQYSRRPVDGEYRGFPNEPRPEDQGSGISCQLGSQCNYDPVQGYQQQFGNDPEVGSYYRQTTVGQVRDWGGSVEPDGGTNGLPEGHA